MTKICSTCKEEKSIDQFNKKKNVFQGNCKKCNSIYHKQHYLNNKADYVAKSKERRIRLQKWFAEFKSTLKCSHCPENHIACLEFHHVNPEEKEMSVPYAVVRHSKQTFLKELNKCIVLCANCHRKLHYP